jgi:hypothetical protein
MKSKPPAKPQLSPQEMQAVAQADHEKWSRIAADPSLSPQAAAWARNVVRSKAAELELWGKVRPQKEQSQPGDEQLGKALGITPSQPSPPTRTNPGQASI